MLEFAEGRPMDRIAARVIATDPAETTLALRIDRGERDQVRRGMPVVTPDGVVGQILEASAGYANVLLIDDAKSRLGARIQRSRARGTVTGVANDRSVKLENDDALLLQNVLRSEDLQDGDVVVTSGTDGVFPPGLVVGRVTSVKRKKTGMFLYAEVLPAVDLNKVEEVLVLSPNPTASQGAHAP
jgi:rod shape-determining protein MreC